MPDAAENEEIRNRSKSLGTVFLAVCMLMAANLLWRHVLMPLVGVGERLRDGERLQDIVNFVGLNLIEMLPALLLLLGVVAAQRVFARMSEGAVFTADNAADIGVIGDNMLWAGVAAILIVPNLSAWVRGERGFFFALENWHLLVAVLGAAIALIGRVLALANRIKAENEQIV
jgi:hypothetical protein